MTPRMKSTGAKAPPPPSLLSLSLLLTTTTMAMLVALALPTAAAASGVESFMTIVNNGGSATLDPSVQHIPLDPALASLRPPPARVPGRFDIFVGLSVFRDGFRCGKTIFTGLQRAAHPDRVFFGVVDQVNPGDSKCLDEYCQMAAAEWPDQGPCAYRDQIRIDERLADDSRGPTLARHHQQNLVRDEEFCLQLDGHSIFTNAWDENLVADWQQVNNEMAILTTYLHHVHDFVKDNGDNSVPSSLPHLCTTIRGGNGLVRNEGASMIRDSKLPQMSALWGAGLSFGKCHAERRVRIDSHTLWMFDGEEFLRASHLWTHGYDLYSPSPRGSVVYHNYSSVPARFEHVHVDREKKELETTRGRNRFNLIVGKPFIGEVDALEMDKFAFGTARSFAQYLAFSGVTFEPGKKDKTSCHQLHWVPYANATEVEAVVGGGWTMRPKGDPPAPMQQPDAPKDKPKAPAHLDKPLEPRVVVDRKANDGADQVDPNLAAAALHAQASTPTAAAAENRQKNLPAKTPEVGNGWIIYAVLFVAVFFLVVFNQGNGTTGKRT